MNTNQIFCAFVVVSLVVSSISPSAARTGAVEAASGPSKTCLKLAADFAAGLAATSSIGEFQGLDRKQLNALANCISKEINRQRKRSRLTPPRGGSLALGEGGLDSERSKVGVSTPPRNKCIEFANLFANYDVTIEIDDQFIVLLECVSNVLAGKIINTI